MTMIGQKQQLGNAKSTRWPELTCDEAAWVVKLARESGFDAEVLAKSLIQSKEAEAEESQ